MRIALIGQKGMPMQFGGVERHVSELSSRLAKLGLDVFVYSRAWYNGRKIGPTSLKLRGTSKSVNIITLPSLRTKHFDAISHTFIATVHAMFQKYDVIHYHGVGPALLAWIPKLKFGARPKIVVTFHCIDRKHQKWGMIAKLCLRLGELMACRIADETITVSKTLAQYCDEAYDKETVYIPNGVVESDGFVIGTKAIKKFGLESNKYILMVSRLVKHKGAHYLIDAFQKLSDRKNMKLVIVGDSAFTDGYVASLKNLAAGDKDIVFTGFQKGQAMFDLYNNAYMIVHPSETEGLPLTVLDAMSYGKTVLASNIPENMEVVENHGFSFKNKNVNDLQTKMEYLLDNQKLVTKTGKEAKSFVMKNYNWNDIALRTKEVYESVAERGEAKVKQRNYNLGFKKV